MRYIASPKTSFNALLLFKVNAIPGKLKEFIKQLCEEEGVRKLWLQLRIY